MAMICMLVLIIVWILQNREPVQVRFLFVSVMMPQAVMLVITLLAGIATGMLVSLERWNRWRRKNVRL